MSKKKIYKNQKLEIIYQLYNKWLVSDCEKDRNLFMQEVRRFTILVAKKHIFNKEDVEDFAQDLMCRLVEKLTKELSTYKEFRNWYFNLRKNDKDIYSRKRIRNKNTLNESHPNYVEYSCENDPLSNYQYQELEELLNLFSEQETNQNKVIFKYLREGCRGSELTLLVNKDIGTTKFTVSVVNSYRNRIVNRLAIFLEKQGVILPLSKKTKP